MKFKSKVSDSRTATVKGQSQIGDGLSVRGHWQIRAFDPNGVLVAVRDYENLVVNEGLNYLINVALGNTAANGGADQIVTWYIGLTDGTPTVAAGDTMASHVGWAEVVAYDEAARPEWVDADTGVGQRDNTASKATFTINADSTTVGGAFLGSDSTKSGTAGTLYSVGAFTGGDVVLSSGSTLEVTATFTVTAT